MKNVLILYIRSGHVSKSYQEELGAVCVGGRGRYLYCITHVTKPIQCTNGLPSCWVIDKHQKNLG